MDIFFILYFVFTNGMQTISYLLKSVSWLLGQLGVKNFSSLLREANWFQRDLNCGSTGLQVHH